MHMIERISEQQLQGDIESMRILASRGKSTCPPSKPDKTHAPPLGAGATLTPVNKTQPAEQKQHQGTPQHQGECVCTEPACLTSCPAVPEALHQLDTQLCHQLEEHRAASDPAQTTCTFYLYARRCQQPFPTCAPANTGHQSRP